MTNFFQFVDTKILFSYLSEDPETILNFAFTCKSLYNQALTTTYSIVVATPSWPEIVETNFHTYGRFFRIKRLNRFSTRQKNEYLLISATKKGNLVLSHTILGYEDVILILLKCGTNPNFQNSFALTISCGFGNYSIAKILLQYRCSNLSDGLIAAARSGYLDIVKLLISTGGERALIRSGTALKVACMHNHSTVVKELLNYSTVDVNFQEGVALHNCCKNGFFICAELLLNAGCNPNHKDGSCLKIAAEFQYWDILKLLREHGGDISFVIKHLTSRRFNNPNLLKEVELKLGL